MVLKTLPKTDYSFLSTQVFAKHSMSLIAREREQESASAKPIIYKTS